MVDSTSSRGNPLRHVIGWAVIVASLLGSSGIAAQGSGARNPAPPPQAALTGHVAPRTAELGAVGIQKISARTGMHRRDIQVLSQWGTIYFPWPKDVKPAPFELEVGKAGAAVRAPGYTDADRARYTAAIDAVLPIAIRRADEAKLNRTRPRP
jgi:hypothetical protein